MPDLLAGSTVRALDTPPAASDAQLDSFSFTHTTYGTGSTSGTYVDCGTAFMSPTTGRVLVILSGEISNASGATTRMAPVVREGPVIGSGALIVPASDVNSVTNQGSTAILTAQVALIENLSPGEVYNVRLEHRVSGGTGTLRNRRVVVIPSP